MKEPDFTIGMACYDNFDETYFTVQSLRIHFPSVIDRFEIVVVDNNPDSLEGRAVRGLIEGRVRGQGRYVPYTERKGSVPPRAHLFDVARGKFVICIDSHVMFEAGALEKIVKFFDDNPDCDDFIQGPLVSNYGPHRFEGTHLNPMWRSSMFGTWGVDDRAKDPDGEPFEIPMHGLGFFAARRESWLGFPKNLEGFSGGEGYIHEKYRQAGRKTICLPGARWYHKFSRPYGIPHKPNTIDKIKNHVRGWTELGIDLYDRNTVNPVRSICEHFVGGHGTRDGKGVVTFEHFKEICREVGYEYPEGTPVKSKSGIVVGPRNFGSFTMRGRPISKQFGWKEVNSRAKISFKNDEKYDIGYVIKASVPDSVRNACERVIWEPLDMWYANPSQSKMQPKHWIRDHWDKYQFDDIICSTYAFYKSAKASLPKGRVRCHFVPHHADPRISPSWYDPDGPVVYSGQKEFINSHREYIQEACDLSGKECVIDTSHHSWQSLEGASLVLAPRLGMRSKMNIECKPTVKIANASLAKIPVLCTPDRSIMEIYPDVKTLEFEKWSDPESVSKSINEALATSPPVPVFTQEKWLLRIREIIW